MGTKQPERIAAVERSVFTVREVCEILGLQKSSAYLAISRGQIASIRIGGQIRVPRAAIDRMLDPDAA